MNLKEILAKLAKGEDLSAEEKAFLVEHKSELTDEQKEAAAEILKSEDDDEDDEEDSKSIDEKGLREVISKEVQEALNSKEKLNEEKVAKLGDKISDGIISKFLAGVKEARKKAHAGTDDDDKDAGKKIKAGEITRKFMKALLAGDIAGAKALSTNPDGEIPDDAKAGLLIPTELMNEVLRVAQAQFGLARRLMRYLPFSGPGNSRTIPALGTSVSVYWTDEGGKKKGTQPKFAIVTQTLKKLAAIVPFTEEILEDSLINITGLVAELFAEAVSKEEDLQFFAGTGSPWTGILNNGDVNQVVQASGDVDNLNADDLLDMIDATPTGALAGSYFILNRTVLSKIRKLKDDTGAYIYQRPQDGTPGQIWDYPYELSDAFPAAADVEPDDAYIVFGNLKNAAIFGDKRQLRVKLLDQATITDADGETVINLAEQDMVALRIVERVGYVLALPKALTVLVADDHQS